MIHNYLKFFCLSLICYGSASAKGMIDCRVMTGEMTECNPYGKRLHHVKEVVYEKDRHKLILVKKRSSPKKQQFTKVISVKDMVTEYVYIEDDMHFNGSDEASLQQPIVLKSSEPKKIGIVSPTKSIKSGDYTVVKGDSLSRISKQLGVKMSLLKS